MDCGLVWSNVDPRRVQDEIRTQGLEHSEPAFGRADQSVMADRELDGPL